LPELDLDMIGVGPFIPHRRRRWARALLITCPKASKFRAAEDVGVPGRRTRRLAVPAGQHPSTTALATLEPRGRP